MATISAATPVLSTTAPAVSVGGATPAPAPGGAIGGGGAPAPAPYVDESMWKIQGQPLKDAAAAIIAMYDRNGDGAISGAKEQTRQVTYNWGYSGGSTTYSIADLTKGADFNRDGSLSAREVERALKRFDSGDVWNSQPQLEPGVLPKRNELNTRTRNDGKLTGSEMNNFMAALGEKYLTSEYWYAGDNKYTDPPKAEPAIAPLKA